jgi:hypothetical protein
MKLVDIINKRINRLPEGYVFTYTDFDIPPDKIKAFTIALFRMVKDGKIRRISPGKFYKPQKTEFGELKPDTYQIVKDLLEKDGKIIGYLTGYSVYNQLGLTTQVAATIIIGVNEFKKSIKRDFYTIRFRKQPNKITKDNIPVLRILDSINNIKEIPDTTIDRSCKTLTNLIGKFDDKGKDMYLLLARKYPPSARALAGALFELNFGRKSAELLFSTLNPASEYNIGASERVLPNNKKWNIL